MRFRNLLGHQNCLWANVEYSLLTRRNLILMIHHAQGLVLYVYKDILRGDLRYLPADKICDPYEICNKCVLGSIVNFPGRAELNYFPLVHDRDGVRNSQCLLLIMGDVNGGDAEAFLDL